MPDFLLSTHIANVPSGTSYAVFGDEKQAEERAPKYVRQMRLAIKMTLWNLTIRPRSQPQGLNAGLKPSCARTCHHQTKLAAEEPIDGEVYPGNVRNFAKNYYNQNQDLVLINANGNMCVKYPKSQRPLHERSCIIVVSNCINARICLRLRPHG